MNGEQSREKQSFLAALLKDGNSTKKKKRKAVIRRRPKRIPVVSGLDCSNTKQ